MSLADKKLKCVDCGAMFTFRASEQKFYASKGFTREPKRCTTCRAAKNQVRGVNRAGVSSISRRSLYPAVCVQCGAHTEVPFSPNGGKPVYCSQCRSLQGSKRR
ncbi:MAG: zinc-ribbon domain containing protein [Dehalococcoidia bacterium]